MMDDIKYCVVFKGEIEEGRTFDDVKKRLAVIFKTDIARIEKLFSVPKTIIKKDVDLQIGKKFVRAFKKAGAICHLERHGIPDIDKTVRINTLQRTQNEEVETDISQVPREQGGLPNAIRKKGPDEKFCPSCGEIILTKAEICPRCGVRQQAELNKVALLLLTFFLGGVGGHKFYIGKYWQGILYFIFFWTGIPGLIALVEFFIYAFTDTEDLQKKYKPSTSIGIIVLVAVVCFMVFIAIIGILAAIAIPQFVTYRNRAYQQAVISELKNLQTAQEVYYAEHNQYALDLNNLRFVRSQRDVTIEIISADAACFAARGTHKELKKPILIDCNGLKDQRP